MDEAELTRRHTPASRAVQGLITLSLLLVVLAYAGVRFPLPASLLDPTLYRALWIVILFLGLGAVVLRRTRFHPLRLQDIADLGGPPALLTTLQRTTLLVAALGALASLIGFLLWVRSGLASDALKAAVVGIAILLYSYPRRAAWRRVLEASQQPGGLTARTPDAKGTTA